MNRKTTTNWIEATLDFTAESAADRGRADAEADLTLPPTGVPEYLQQGKNSFEAQIRAIDVELVLSATKTTEMQGWEDGEDPSNSRPTLEKETYQDMRDELAALKEDRDVKIDEERARKYNPAFDEERIRQAEAELNEAKGRFTDAEAMWLRVRDSKPTINPFAKWILIVMIAGAEVFANLDWLKNLITSDSPIPGVPVMVFVGALAFVVSLILNLLGEKAGEALRQRIYKQMAWMLLICIGAGLFIAFYREYALEKAISDLSTQDVKPPIVVNGFVVGVSIALASIFTGMSVLIGYYSAYGFENFESAKTDFETTQKKLNDATSHLKTLREEKIDNEEGFEDEKLDRIDKLKQKYQLDEQQVKSKFAQEIEGLREASPRLSSFAEAYVSARQRVELAVETFSKFVVAYVTAYAETSGQPVVLPEGWDVLTVPKRLLDENPDTKAFATSPK